MIVYGQDLNTHGIKEFSPQPPGEWNKNLVGGKGAALLVIEGIPMWSCSRCGESYFTAQTMHEIERIKALRKSVAVSRSVPVAAFERTDA